MAKGYMVIIYDMRAPSMIHYYFTNRKSALEKFYELVEEAEIDETFDSEEFEIVYDERDRKQYHFVDNGFYEFGAGYDIFFNTLIPNEEFQLF